jgi:membrane protein YqaA with SNARE-associated domain
MLWGFAEATLFFIVPDVLLSYATLRRGSRLALSAGLPAAAGALLGGAMMYWWGAQDPLGAEAVLDRIPAIGTALIETVRADMAAGWLAALFAGAFSGVPYKIFAVEAGRAGVDPGVFLAASVPARYARFAVTVLVTALVRYGLEGIGRERWAVFILTGFWLCFYAVYFAGMSGEP